MTTKERITEEALTLFSENGYQGTSVKSIADAVGIRDASLYKHFKSKQEIFSSIVDLINTHIEGLSNQLGMPSYDASTSSSASFYKSLDLDGLKKEVEGYLKKGYPVALCRSLPVPLFHYRQSLQSYNDTVPTAKALTNLPQ